MIKNIKGLLTQATSLPAAIEAKLPEGAPKVSTMLLDVAGKIPDVPDFPVELPDLPAPPELPEMPGGGLRRIVTGVEVTPVKPRETARESWLVTPEEVRGLVGQGHTVRDYA